MTFRATVGQPEGVETAENIPPTASRPRNLRSRITNGADILHGIDGRLASARRYRDLTEAFRAEFGLGASEREMAAIRLAAALTVQSETLQAAIVRGERVAEEELTRALNAQARALRELRLMQKRRAPRPGGRHELDAIADGLKKGAGK